MASSTPIRFSVSFPLTGGGDFALVRYESPNKFCHRHLVANWLTENGYASREYVKPKE